MDFDEITAIIENKYSVDCVQLVLEPQIPGKGQKTHKGAGLISQTRSGDISPQDVFSVWIGRRVS
jgi:hypothetical protein